MGSWVYVCVLVCYLGEGNAVVEVLSVCVCARAHVRVLPEIALVVHLSKQAAVCCGILKKLL